MGHTPMGLTVGPLWSPILVLYWFVMSQPNLNRVRTVPSFTSNTFKNWAESGGDFFFFFFNVRTRVSVRTCTKANHATGGPRTKEISWIHYQVGQTCKLNPDRWKASCGPSAPARVAHVIEWAPGHPKSGAHLPPFKWLGCDTRGRIWARHMSLAISESLPPVSQRDHERKGKERGKKKILRKQKIYAIFTQKELKEIPSRAWA